MTSQNKPWTDRYRQSRFDAFRNALEEPRKIKTANVVLDLQALSLRLHVDLRDRETAVTLRNKLVGLGLPWINSLHAEILGNDTPRSFLLRLVRRELDSEIAPVSFTLRVGGGDFKIVKDIFDEVQCPAQGLIADNFIKIFTTYVEECVILLSGHDIAISTIHHKKLCRVGEAGEFPREEAVDIN